MRRVTCCNGELTTPKTRESRRPHEVQKSWSHSRSPAPASSRFLPMVLSIPCQCPRMIRQPARNLLRAPGFLSGTHDPPSRTARYHPSCLGRKRSPLLRRGSHTPFFSRPVAVSSRLPPVRHRFRPPANLESLASHGRHAPKANMTNLTNFLHCGALTSSRLRVETTIVLSWTL